jgi:hypothetical protein
MESFMEDRWFFSIATGGSLTEQPWRMIMVKKRYPAVFGRIDFTN